MLWLEQKYVGLLSGRLRNYTRKSNSLYNFSCPICGDSANDKRKARGYIYEKKGKGLYHCHNCGTTMSVPNFIKSVDQGLYNEFVLEKLKDEKSPEQRDLEDFVNKMKKPVFMKEGILKGLKKVSQLSPDHPIKKYVESRKIPTPYHSKLFVCPNFYAFTNQQIPGKFSEGSLKHDETRLLIPFLNKEKKVHAYQGRSLSNAKDVVRYITIVLDESVPKLFGLDALDESRRVYVLEGPIDSMFIPNSVATAGGDLVAAVHSLNKENLVVVYDNEPRSRETVKKIDKAINNGYNVCIWPENFDHKDVNDMIMAGLSAEFIRYIIDQNTFSDLKAKLALKRWSKV